MSVGLSLLRSADEAALGIGATSRVGPARTQSTAKAMAAGGLELQLCSIWEALCTARAGNQRLRAAAFMSLPPRHGDTAPQRPWLAGTQGFDQMFQCISKKCNENRF